MTECNKRERLSRIDQLTLAVPVRVGNQVQVEEVDHSYCLQPDSNVGVKDAGLQSA